MIMIDKTDFLLYGGGVVAVTLIMLLGYQFFRKNSKGVPKRTVMNKIQDFYSTEDKTTTNY